MNSQCFSRIHNEFTLFFANSLWIYYWFREFTTKSRLPSFSWIHYNFLPLSRIQYESANSLWIIYCANSELIQFSQINYLFGEFTINSLSISRTYNEFTIFSAITLWVQWVFREFLIFREFTSFLGKLLWIYLVICDSLWIFEKSPWILYLFCELKMNSLSLPLLHFKINSTSFSRIHYLFRDSKINKLSVSWIRHLFCENTMNSLSFTLYHYEFAIFFTIQLRFYFLFS